MRGSLIIQARTGSTRLPNKMTGLFGDESLLGWVIENLKSWRSVQTIVVATSTNDNDDAIERIALESGVACIRGDEEDVVARMLAAATWTNEGWIFRVCADNPFLCEDLFDELLLNVNRYPEASYIGFQVSGIPAILTDYGLFVEAINTAALKTVHPRLNAHQREHATLALLESKDAILLPMTISQSFRLTVDTEEDRRNALFVKELVGKPPFDSSKLLSHLHDLPSEILVSMLTQRQLNRK